VFQGLELNPLQGAVQPDDGGGTAGQVQVRGPQFIHHGEKGVDLGHGVSRREPDVSKPTQKPGVSSKAMLAATPPATPGPSGRDARMGRRTGPARTCRGKRKGVLWDGFIGTGVSSGHPGVFLKRECRGGQSGAGKIGHAALCTQFSVPLFGISKKMKSFPGNQCRRDVTSCVRMDGTRGRV